MKKSAHFVFIVTLFMTGFASAEDLQCTNSTTRQTVKLIEAGGQAYAKLKQPVAEFSAGEYNCKVFGSDETKSEKYADYLCRQRSLVFGMRAYQDLKRGVVTLSLYRQPVAGQASKPLAPFFEADCQVD